MIRKPAAEDFREGAAVTVLRESRKIAVESGRGVGAGVAKVYSYWMFGMMGFGLLMSVLTNLGGVGILVVGGGAIAYFFYRKGRSDHAPLPPVVRRHGAEEMETAPGFGAGVTQSGRQVSQSGELQLEISALARQAITLLIPSAILVLLGPLMVVGIVLGALALLLAARMFSDRTVMRYDSRSVIVTGLLGSGELLWLDVDDVSVRISSRFNLKVLFTSGARRNLVISASRNSLGGPRELLVPVDLLNLDREELVGLVTNLLCCRAAGGEAVPSWQTAEPNPAPSPAVIPMPTPASGPRHSFDPDAIIARHLAERRQLVAEQRPDLVQNSAPRKAVFGRKVG